MTDDGLLSRLAHTGVFYRARFMDPLWGHYPDASSSRRQSLALFLRGYAFEHAGRDPHWSPFAAELVESLGSDSDLDSPDTERMLWDAFSKHFGGTRLNPKTNPLAPRGTHYTGGQSTAEMSAVALSRMVREPLVFWARQMLAPSRIDQVHEKLASINGVGTKIASFFLRDVALQYSVFPEFDRFLCFPVDRWVRRVSRSLWPELSGRDDLFIANEAVGHCLAERACPELVNAGMWYLGAIIGSETGDSDLAEYTDDWGNVIQSYATRIRAMAEAWSAFEPAQA